MRREELESLPNYWGIYYDAATGMTYREDGSATGFTFEHAKWTGPFGLHFNWPFLNPLGFATAETAEKVLGWARSFAPASLELRIDDERKDLGPFTRTVERQIVVSDGAREESFSAGFLANSIIRNGEKAAADSFKAEWKTARLTF